MSCPTNVFPRICLPNGYKSKFQGGASAHARLLLLISDTIHHKYADVHDKLVNRLVVMVAVEEEEGEVA